MLSCKYRTMPINRFCVLVVALANVAPAFCGIFYGGYQQQAAPLTLNPGPSPPSPSAPSAAPTTVTTTYSSPSSIPISYTPHATSSSFRHQFSHSVPATTTTQGVATAYVAISPGSSYGNSYANNVGFSSSPSQGASSPPAAGGGFSSPSSSSAGGYASYSFTAAGGGNSSPSSQSNSNGAQQYGNGYGFGGYAGYGGGNSATGGSSGLSG